MRQLFFRLSPTEALLRIGVAFAFLYPPIDALLEPAAWLGYFPGFVIKLFHFVSVPMKWSDMVLLHGFGLLEVVLAVWVLFGRRVRVPAIIMALMLFVIVGFNLDPSNFSVLFRDVSIAFAALALAVWRRPAA